MARISLGNGKWFSTKYARYWDEDTTWNGNNHISKATGTQFEHERLYLTKLKTYVLHAWSQWQGSIESWEIISVDDAHAWLIAQGEADSVPAEIVAAAEV